MARKHNGTDSSELLQFDSRTKAVMAQSYTMENMKEKISKVREHAVSSSKDDIVQVLHHFDGDVERAKDAFRQDGAQTILSQWNVPNRRGKAGGSNQKSKNKKKKHKGGVDGEVISDEATVPNNNNNVEKPTHHKTIITSQPNGHVPTNSKPKDSTVQQQQPLPRRGDETKSTQEKPPSGAPSHNQRRDPRRENNNPTSRQNNRDLPNHQRGGGGSGGGNASRGNKSDAKPQRATPPKKSGVTIATSTEQHKRGGQASNQQQQQSGRRRNISTGSDKGGKGDRVRTVSENSTSQDPNKPKNPSAVLERVSKDLQRTQVSLTRHINLMNEEFEKSEKRLKKAYEDAKHSLEQRENEMMRQLKEVKRQATNLLETRQVRAAELKLETARVASMSDQQLTVIRADIKHFVSDRKVDEEIGRTMRFVWNPDPLEQAIKSTGEVIPIQTFYTTRRPSITSDTSGTFSRTVSVSEDGPLSSRSSSRVDSVPVTPTSPDMDMKTEVENFAARLQRSLDSRGGPRRARNDRSRSQGRPGVKDKREQGNNPGKKIQDSLKEEGRQDRDDQEKSKSSLGRRNRGGRNRGEQSRPNRGGDQVRDSNRGGDQVRASNRGGKDNAQQNRRDPKRERLSSSSSTGKGEESPDGSPKKNRNVRRREQFRRRHNSKKGESDTNDAKPEDNNVQPKDSQSPKPDTKDSKPVESSISKGSAPLVNGTAHPKPDEGKVKQVDTSKSDLPENSKDAKPVRPNELNVVPNGPKTPEQQNEVMENHIGGDADHTVNIDTSKDIKSKLIPNGDVVHGKEILPNGKSDDSPPMTNGNVSSGGESSPVKENGEGNDALPQRKPRERRERGSIEKAITEVVKEVSAMNGVAEDAEEEIVVEH